MRLKVLRPSLLVIVFVSASAITSLAADPDGTWLTEEGKATVRVSDCGGALCATIIALKDPNDPQTGRPMTDTQNADASKRNRPLVGVQILIGMRAQGPNKWAGQVYDPEDGKTNAATVVLEDVNHLKIQGCVVFVCGATTWTRKR
jgi:uncharacterized protein (DUF2147 family)